MMLDYLIRQLRGMSITEKETILATVLASLSDAELGRAVALAIAEQERRTIGAVANASSGSRLFR